jgi:uncharacterized protein
MDRETISPSEQYSMMQLIVLHLAPGAIFTAVVIAAVSVLESWDIDPIFALFGAIGLVLVPLELGYLSVYARRTTGSWNPLRAVNYRNKLPARRLVLLAGGLAIWFLIALFVSIALIDEWLALNVFGWMPDALLQFTVVEEDEEGFGPGTLVAFLVIAIAFNGVAGPVTEELYFRGHLLPRMERLGRWAPILNTVLFGVYHFFSPWRYPAIIIGFLPIAWATWRTRSVSVAIAAHVTINLVTVLIILAAAIASSD